LAKFHELRDLMMSQIQCALSGTSQSTTSSTSSSLASVADSANSPSLGTMIFNNDDDGSLFNSASPFRYHRFTLAHSLKTGDPRTGQATETDHYHEIINKLTPHIYLGNESLYDLNLLKFEHGITHIINCSDAPNLYPEQFDYLQIATLKDARLLEVIQFINKAINECGKVILSYRLLKSEIAVALVLAYLIEQHHLTYFEAFTLMKNRRYIVKPISQIVAKLRTPVTSTLYQPDTTADRAPGMFLWDDDKMVKEKKKKEKEKEKNREKAKEEADEVEHTAFNPLVFNRNLQERIRRNVEAGRSPLHISSRPRLRRSSSTDDVVSKVASSSPLLACHRQLEQG